MTKKWKRHLKNNRNKIDRLLLFYIQSEKKDYNKRKVKRVWECVRETTMREDRRKRTNLFQFKFNGPKPKKQKTNKQ